MLKNKIYAFIKKQILLMNVRRENLDILLSIIMVAGIYTFMTERNFIPNGMMNANLSAELSTIILRIVILGVLLYFISLALYLLKVGIRGLAIAHSSFKQRRFFVSLASFASSVIAPICFYYCYKLTLSGKICAHGWECNPSFVGNPYALPYVTVCAMLMYLIWVTENHKNAVKKAVTNRHPGAGSGSHGWIE